MVAETDSNEGRESCARLELTERTSVHLCVAASADFASDVETDRLRMRPAYAELVLSAKGSTLNLNSKEVAKSQTSAQSLTRAFSLAVLCQNA